MFPIHFIVDAFGFHKQVFFYEGLYFAIAILVGFFVAKKNIPKSGIASDDFYQLLMVALCAGILGGRMFHQFFYESPFGFENVVRIFQVWKGGLSITGAVVLGPLFTYLYCRYRKYDFWKLFALVVPAIILSQAVGRVGCFLNGDAHGTKTESVFGVEFPRYGYLINTGEVYEHPEKSSDAWEYSFENDWVQNDSVKSVALHPSQLYEAIADLLLFFVLTVLLRGRLKTDGSYTIVPLVYVGGYAFIRFLLEFVRADRLMQGSDVLSNMQMVLLACVLCCSVFVVLVGKGKMNIGNSKNK